MITVLPCNDAPLLAQLNEEVQSLHHRLRPDMFKPYDQAGVTLAIAAMLQTPGIQGFLARCRDQPAGYMIVQEIDRPESAFTRPSRYLLIDQIGVLEKYQGLGLGQALVEQAKAVASGNGMHRIQLEHWTLNAGARAFFGRAGFNYYMEKMEMQVE